MKFFLFLFTLSISAFTIHAQNFQWAKKLASNNNSTGNSIATDASGNVYTVGSFTSKTDFDPGAGTYNLTPVGTSDIFISKLNSTGNFIWAKQMGAGGYDIAYAVAVDASGNVYTIGSFSAQVDFDPGAGTYDLISAGGTDIFISKLSASGNFIWAKRMGDTGNDYGSGICISSAGNVFITGQFTGITDFNPGGGIFNLTSNGGIDCFISKFSSAGGFLWAKQLGSPLDDYGAKISTDTADNVYTIGSFRDSLDFDPGPGLSYLVSAGQADVFISKLSASGNFIFAKRMGGTTLDSPGSIAVDAIGNIYSTGSFNGTVDFDPGPGSFNLTASGGGSDIFISKLDNSGSLSWAKRMGSTSIDLGNSIAIDAAGNVLTTGTFWGSVDFDPGANISNLTSSGFSDIYVSKLDNSGNFIYAKRIGGTFYDQGLAIAVDASGGVFTTGQFQQTVDFDPGTSVYNLSTAYTSSFISKLGICTPAVVINISSTSPILCPGFCDTLKATGANTYTWSPAAGLSATTGGTVTACPAVTTVYTVSGTNPAGCTIGDETVLVTVNPVPSVSPAGSSSTCEGISLSYSVVPAANTYQWKKNGINIPGETSATYITSASGSYSAFVTTSCGAYTTAPATYTLNLKPSSVITAAGNTTFCSGDSIILNVPFGSNRSYEWYLFGTTIAGATSSSYTAKTPGNYTAGVTNTNTGCYGYSSQAVLVSVDPIPNVAFTISGPLTFCSGGNVSFTATEIGPTYQWIRNGVDISGATDQSYTATTSGTYKVRGTNALGCSATSSGTVVTSIALPSKTVTASGPLSFCNGDSVVFTAASGTGFTYKWKKNGTNISGATNQKYTAKTAGTYKVTVTKSASGCSATSSGKVVTVPCKLYEGNDMGINYFSVYPNPSSGTFMVSLNEPISEGALMVYDVFGKNVFMDKILNSAQKEIKLVGLLDGVYFICIADGKKNYRGKMILRQK